MGSSSIRIGVSLRTARAMDNRCRCPVDNLPPRSPSSVEKPSGIAAINPSAQAIFAAL